MSSSTGVKKDAFQGYGTATNTSGQLGQNAQNIYGSLAPELEAQAAHPQGYTPQQTSAINTAGQQSAGGSMAGATGQGALLAARTRNAGAGANAIQQSGRNASDNLSRVATGTEIGSANLANEKQASAQKGLEGLNSTELGGSLHALGLGNEFLNTENQAKPTFWQMMAQKAGSNVLNAGLDSAEGYAGC